jgi:pimeloyl-ACP methyl ester carboxylesterase
MSEKATEPSPGGAAAGIKFRDCFTNAIRLRVAMAGEGPLVVLLHGFPDGWRCWERQIPQLAEHFRVAAPDLRGYGGSDRPDEGYDLATLADDVAGLIHNLGRGAPAAVIGHDWGGTLAWALAYRHPEKVTRLSILNAPQPHAFARRLAQGSQALRSFYMFLFQIPYLPERALAMGDGALLRGLIRAGAGRRDTLSDGEVRAMAESMRGAGAVRGGLSWYRGARRAGPGSAKAYRGAVQVPVQIIWGESDPALPPSLLDGIERYAPGVRIDRLPGVGHWVTREAADDVGRLLLDWLLPDAAAPARVTA